MKSYTKLNTNFLYNAIVSSISNNKRRLNSNKNTNHLKELTIKKNLSTKY